MKTLRDILQAGGGVLYVRQQDATVADAAELMTQKNVGIVAVLDGQKLVGLVSERDIVRRVIQNSLDPKRTHLSQVMTTDLVVASEDESFRTAISQLDQANIRHLPVVRGDVLISMLSIRDLLRVDMQQMDQQIKFLHAYLYEVPAEIARGPGKSGK